MARKKIKNRKKQSFWIRRSGGDPIVLTAKDSVEASMKAVNLFAMQGVVPEDLTGYVPHALPLGYDFFVALKSDAQRGGPFEADLFVGFRDETGEFSPCCGSPGTITITVGRCVVENEAAA